LKKNKKIKKLIFFLLNKIKKKLILYLFEKKTLNRKKKMVVTYVWHMYCEDEDAEVSRIVPDGTTPAAVCPNNGSHVIRTNSVWKDLNTRAGDVTETKIQMADASLVGVNFLNTSHHFVATGPEGSTTKYTYSYDINVAITQGDFIYNSDQQNDVISIVISPPTPVGYCTPSVPAEGATTIYASTTALNAYQKGYHLQLLDGSGHLSSEVKIMSIDKTAGTLTVKPGIALQSVITNAGPVYLKLNKYMVFNHVLGPPAHLSTGQSVLSASVLPANFIVTIAYTNNGAEPFVGVLKQPAAIGDTWITVSKEFLNYMQTHRNWFKLSDGTTTSCELLYDNFDISSGSADQVRIEIKPALDVAFDLSNPNVKIQKTCTKKIYFATDGQF
jgi:hypothetical protein